MRGGGQDNMNHGAVIALVWWKTYWFR